MRHLSLPTGPLTIVCLAAHPDDIEIAAGATLLALAERGAVEGHWLTLTGSPERRVEAEAAAEAFLPGSQSSFHAYPDGRLPAYWNEVKDILHAFAAGHSDVDVVFTPRIDDAHQDHRLLGTMAPTVWRDVWCFTMKFQSGMAIWADPTATYRSRLRWGSASSLLNNYYRRNGRGTGGTTKRFSHSADTRYRMPEPVAEAFKRRKLSFRWELKPDDVVIA